MNKTVLYSVSAIIVVVLAFFTFNAYIYNEKQGDPVSRDYKNIEYGIEGSRVLLQNGVAETTAAPGSATKITTRYFGNEVRKDINADGKEDIIFLMTHTTGGSGTFYYVVAAVSSGDGYVGSEGILLGDRIAPQTTTSGPRNIVIVTYADRAPGQDFSVEPSVGKSINLLLDTTTMQFGEVAQNFEGEANPETMSLNMKKWVWVSALYDDERTVMPKEVGVFTLTFTNDGNFSASTDCNSMTGKYAAETGTLVFGPIASTKMFCEGSQEIVFGELLRDTAGYHFTSKGELILDLKFDSGSVVFR